MRDGAIGGEPQGDVVTEVADVVGARGALGQARAPLRHRSQPDADHRSAVQGTDQADQRRRTVDPPLLAVARCEVDDLQRRAGGVDQLGAQDRRVAQVGLTGLGASFQIDRPVSQRVIFGSVASAQQG